MTEQTTHPASEQAMAEHLITQGYPRAQAGIVAAHYWSTVRAGGATWQGLETYADEQDQQARRRDLTTEVGTATGRRAYQVALAQLAEQCEQSGAPRYVAAHCVSCGAWLLAGHAPGCWVGAIEAAEGKPEGTPVSDALQAVDRVQGEPGRFGTDANELAALRDLADAVRSHGIGADLGQLREDRATVTEAQLAAAYLAARGLGKVLQDDVLTAIILAARQA